MQYVTSNGGKDVPLAADVSEFQVEMRDGVSLYTHLTLPAGTKTCPLVFVRNPYVGKDSAIQAHCDYNYSLLKNGYGIVLQHCRGCGLSGGDCIPYVNERNDGLDTLDWIRGLSCYAGEIYLSGGSYLSSVHFSYLDTVPPDVKGAVLPVQDVDRYNILYRNGFFKCGLHGGWFIGMYKKNSMPKKNYVEDSFRMLPLSRFSETVFGENVPAFDEPLRHPDREDPFWKTPAGGSDYFHALTKLQIPVLLVTAFHDLYTEGIFRMWDSLPAENRKNCAMIVTPYSHGFNGPEVLNFESGCLSTQWPDFTLNWFNSIRTGEPLRFAKRGMTTYYSLFDGAWRSEPFLKPGPEKMEFFLNDRTLDPKAGENGEITYVYNPAAPASFKGGCCNNFGGMQIQDPPNSRYDIVSYLSEPFGESVLAGGPMSLGLHVRSDRPDTCFYARLSLVRENVAYGLRDDILSLTYGKSEAYEPGRETVLQFHFAEHSFRIGRGDRIRLDISSSCWPYFVPHTNRAGLFSEQTGADIAHNTIIRGKSKLVLHVSQMKD